MIQADRTVLFISRKNINGVGGLSRFFNQLYYNYPGNKTRLSPDKLSIIFKLPFLKFDLIYLCDATLLPFGLLLKILFKKPLTLTAHGLDLVYPNQIYQYILKKFLPKVDFIILDSHEAKKLLSKFSISEMHFKVVPLGININQFISTKQINLPTLSNKITLLTVGRLVPRKGHIWFIENVFLHLPKKYIYLIVGNGPQKNKLKQKIRQLSLEKRVFLLGQLSDSQLGTVYKKTVIFIAPNIDLQDDFEGFGLSFGEAAALGLPVIATNVDGIPEIIKNNKNGLLIPPTPENFLNAIYKMDNKPFKKNLLKKAKSYTLKNFKWQKTAQKYAQIFKQVVDKNLV